jgi:predicted alpha/beta-fold hydrolase
MLAAVPPFEPRPGWRGPDLQTLRNTLRPPRPAPADAPWQRLTLPLHDGSGDRLAARLERPPPNGRERPLAVLIHGLGGCEESSYLAVSAAALRARGHPVLRLNLRGAGPSGPLCRLHYHAGRIEDLRDALASLPAPLGQAGFVLLGFSLGGNLVLKFLAEYGRELPVRAAAAVSAPIDLAAAARRFLAPRNRFYQWHMLRGLKREAEGDGGKLSARERAAVRGARTLWEFDDRFVAPRNGWASAEAYYAASMALPRLPEIRVPTLLVHALDDPWIPPDAYLGFPWRRHPALTALLPARGGHVGFHGQGDRRPWHDRCLGAFLDEQGL